MGKTSRGRYAPPVVEVPPPDHPAYEVSLDEDERFFMANPDRTERRRPYVPGETHEPLPPGTITVVKRIGYFRVRSFLAPSVEGN
jgi:hypothetical protein